MQWDSEDLKCLLAFTHIVDSDDIRFKEVIKKVLLNNRYIIHVLNNEELEASDAEADDYYNVNILPYFMITPTQTNVQNFICYEVHFDEEARYNSTVRKGQISFYIMCEQKNLIDTETSIARHDLLAALLLDEFNWTNLFGNQIHCISDVASVVDSTYSCRTLIFEGEFSNSIAKNKLNINSTGRKPARIINTQNVPPVKTD